MSSAWVLTWRVLDGALGIVSEAQGGPVSLARTYDSYRGWLKSIVGTNNNDMKMNLAYSYFDDGRVKQTTDNLSTAYRTTDYSYL